METFKISYKEKNKLKRKFSKILGVGLALSLLASLLLAGAPALADVSEATVTLDEEEISVAEEYIITFEPSEQLFHDGVDLEYSDDSIANEVIGVGDAVEDTFEAILAETPIVPGTVVITDESAVEAFADDGEGTLTGDQGGEGTINYDTGAVEVEFDAAPADDDDILADYDYQDGDVITIEVRFPEDTTVPDGALVEGDDFTVSASPGWIDGAWDTDPETGGITASGDEDDLIVTFTLAGGDEIGSGSTVRVELLPDGDQSIINPPDPGTYTLEVRTSEEDDWIESAEYEIDAPTVGGFVYVRNDSNVLLATYGGEDALWDAFDDEHFDRDDATIEVGEGTYTVDFDLEITGEDLTLVSTEGADDTVIDADGGSIIITGEGVTVEDFTIDDAGTAISIDAEDVTVTGNVITDADIGVEILAGAINATVSDNVIEACADGIVFADNDPDVVDMDDVDIKDNEITEADNRGAIVFEGGTENVDITGNTITANDTTGILFEDGTMACVDIKIEGNTISENDGNGIECADDQEYVSDDPGPEVAGEVPDELEIRENDILDNEDVGVLIAGWTNLTNSVMFNNIHGNDGNLEAPGDVNARFNWWGTADEDEIEDELDGDDIEYEPWLMDAQGTVSAGSTAEYGDEASLDGRDDVGVNVSGMDDDDGNGADIISAFKYAANPEDEIDDAIAFFDVFVLLDGDVVALDEVNGKLKFYDSAIDEGSVASFWTGDFWAECSDQEARDGVVYVDLNEDTVPSFDEMEETPFVVTGGEAETGLGAAELLAPEVGEVDVSLRPAFAWSAVEDADGYNFELADNADFIVPLVKLSDDLSMLTVTAYGYRPGLDYSASYYWRVRAVAGDASTHKKTHITTFEEEGDWVTGVFTTMDEPTEEAPPVVVEEVGPPEITVEPIVEVITPAATPITPAWIYVIIGVGGVLVIALIVLIVRTRRVA